MYSLPSPTMRMMGSSRPLVPPIPSTHTTFSLCPGLVSTRRLRRMPRTRMLSEDTTLKPSGKKALTVWSGASSPAESVKS